MHRPEQRWSVISAVNRCSRRTNPSTARSAKPGYPEIAHPNQIVGREGQDKLKVQLRAADKPALAHAADGLRPAKAFFDSFTDSLAERITFVAGVLLNIRAAHRDTFVASGRRYGSLLRIQFQQPVRGGLAE